MGKYLFCVLESENRTTHGEQTIRTTMKSQNAVRKSAETGIHFGQLVYRMISFPATRIRSPGESGVGEEWQDF